MEMTVFFQGVFYFLKYDLKTPAIPPVFLLKAHSMEIPEKLYRLTSNFRQLKNPFTCDTCGQRVMQGLQPNDRDRVQLCRCFLVEHFQPKLFISSQGWEKIQQAYKEESLNPAPDNPLIIDPFSAMPFGPTPEGINYFARKVGFRHPVKIKGGGSLIETAGGSIYIDPQAKSISMQADLKGLPAEKLEDLVRAWELKTGGVPPPTFVVVGDDPDYVFPAGAKDIRPLAFSCKNCGKTVQQARLGDSLLTGFFVITA